MFEAFPEVLNLDDVSTILRCERASVYEMSRERSQAKQTHALRFLKLPCGLRVRKQDLIDWLERKAAERA